MSDRNKALITSLVGDVWNMAHYDRVDDLISRDYVGHPSGVVGTDAYKRYYLDLRSAFPDLEFTVEDQIAEGDRVATRWTARGTHRGPFSGLPGTGRPGMVEGTSTHRIADDKVIECWTSMDELGLLRQIGALPAPGAG
jgi:steroid delta-isomerase-like uncharacterized protein